MNPIGKEQLNLLIKYQVEITKKKCTDEEVLSCFRKQSVINNATNNK